MVYSIVFISFLSTENQYVNLPFRLALGCCSLKSPQKCELPSAYLCAPMPALSFDLIKTDDHSSARAGKITTDHGIIETPIFMPVGTIGSVKAISQSQLVNEVDPHIILGNTYHLYMRPGMETMEASGR